MAISEFEEKRCEREMEKFLAVHRPPAHIRSEVDITYRLENQSVEIFEVRPHWQNKSEKTETPVAKATYVKKEKEWRIYWHKSDMKWHRYEPKAEVRHFEEFLSIFAEDKHCCFWG